MSDFPEYAPGLIPLSRPSDNPWEIEPIGEADAIAVVTAMIETQVRTAAISPPARRDAHPKAHGCVSAQVRVLGELPAPLRTGLFATPGVYAAWIRFSNGSGKLQADRIGDARGMAIKVMGVAGSASGTQDLIVINHPVFFVRNAVDYIAFQRATNPAGFFFPGWNPFQFRLHELLAALAVTRRKVSTPLNTTYWSMTPFLFGAVPCKFSVRPVGAPSMFEDRSTPNFLHDNLAKALNAADAQFDLCVQRQTDAKSMPVEDPTIPWSETAAPFVPVARITIPRQSFDRPVRIAFGENLSFTPWHGLPEHRPLGGINRARRAVYETISRVRHEINGSRREEPTPNVGE